jgi:hypothetical protein
MNMRRAIAISLMMLFSWTLIAPFYARDCDANLPACCRKNGKHYCAMRTMGQRAGDQRGFTTVAERCPCCPLNFSSTKTPTYKAEAAGAFYAAIVSHPALAPQTEAYYRISSLRSHQKRGPPTSLA